MNANVSYRPLSTHVLGSRTGYMRIRSKYYNIHIQAVEFRKWNNLNLNFEFAYISGCSPTTTGAVCALMSRKARDVVKS